MSQATIRTGVAAILTAAGAKNVNAEEPTTFDLASMNDRQSGGRLHFWIVRASRAPGVGGAGYIDRRHVMTCDGYVGVSRDDPASGEKSDVYVTDLFDDVVRGFENPANAHPGNAIDFEGVTVQRLPLEMVTFGQQKLPSHRLRIVATYLEAN